MGQIILKDFHMIILDALKIYESIKKTLHMKEKESEKIWETIFHMIKSIKIPKKRKEILEELNTMKRACSNFLYFNEAIESLKTKTPSDTQIPFHEYLKRTLHHNLENTIQKELMKIGITDHIDYLILNIILIVANQTEVPKKSWEDLKGILLNEIISTWSYFYYSDEDGEFGELIINCSKLLLKLDLNEKEEEEFKKLLEHLCSEKAKEDEPFTLKDLRCPKGKINKLLKIAQVL